MFVLAVGSMQALYISLMQLYAPQTVRERMADKTIMILDGSRIEPESNDNPELGELLNKPKVVMQYDGDGRRKASPAQQKKAAQEEKAKRREEQRKAKEAARLARQEKKQAKAAKAAKKRALEEEAAGAAARTADREEAAASVTPPPQPPPEPPVPPPSSPLPPPESAPTSPATSAEADPPADAAGAGDSSRSLDAPSDEGARRPMYVWAQNATCVFVTLRLERSERLLTPLVHFEERSVRVRLPAPDAAPSAAGGGAGGGAVVALRIETSRYLVPSECGWQHTGRGLLLNLRKRSPGHWAALLRDGKSDARLSVDWTRWHHPVAERSDAKDAMRDEFERLNTARAREVDKLKPRFGELLAKLKLSISEETDEQLEPEEAIEMLRAGEAILRHYQEEREQREALLGDKPLPAGDDEEQLERALIHLREMERQGVIQLDRNTPSWRVHRERQKKRKKRLAERGVHVP